MKSRLYKIIELWLICLWFYIPLRVFALDISGIVRHEDGVTPFEGASVYAISRDYPHNESLMQMDYHGPVQTDELGRYVLSDLPETSLTVRVFAPKMYPQQWFLDISESKENTQHDFILAPAPVLAGRAPIPGVDKIWFHFYGEGQISVWGRAGVQSDGKFTIVLAESKEYELDGEKVTEQANQQSSCDWYAMDDIRKLPETISYSLQIRPAGYEPIFYPRLTFHRGKVTSLEIYPSQATGSLSGQVVDSAGMPVEGLGVRAWRSFDARNQPDEHIIGKLTAISDEHGKFTLSDVPAGTYLIEPWISPETMDSRTCRWLVGQYTFHQVQISLSKGETFNQLKIVVEPKPAPTAIWVNGRIFADDGKTDLPEHFIRYQFWFYLHPEKVGNSGGGTLKTDKDGRYRLRFHGEDSDYWLTMFHNGSPITRHFKGNEKMRITDFDYVMKPLPDEEMRITGQAIEKTTGEPIPNIPLVLQTLPSEFRIRLFTDAQGRFRLDQFPSKDERLKIQFVDYQDYPYPPQWEEEEGVEVEIVDGKARDVIVPLQRTAKLSVKITSKKHEVEYSSVWLDGPQVGKRDGIGGSSGTSDHRIFDNVPPGVYRISASGRGFKSQQRTIEVKPGVYDIDVTFELEAYPRTSVSGRVEWPDGKPSEHVTVYLVQQHHRGYLKKQFLTQADGAFAFDNLIQGSYKIILKVPGFPIQEQEVRLYEDLQDFVFRIKRGTQLRGKLVFEDGVPYPERPLLVLGQDNLAKGAVMTSRIQGVWKPHRMLGQMPSYFFFQHHFAQFLEEDKFTFFFDRVLPGEYWISFWDDGLPDSTGQAIPLITPIKIVLKDLEDNFIEIPIEKMGLITGHVFGSQTKQPIVDAEVLIKGEPIQRAVYTDKQGYYRCELPTGKYKVMVYAPNGDLKVTLQAIQVTKNEATTVDIPLIDVN